MSRWIASTQGGGLWNAERLYLALKAKGMTVRQLKCSGYLVTLERSGDLIRKERGTYARAVDESPTVVPKLPVAPVAPVATPQPASAGPIMHADETELDEALAALGRIEAVVRRYKDAIRQLNELKRTLGALNL